MAYVVPTPADIRVAYPEFADVSDGSIQNALDQAATAVDTSWSEIAFPVAYKLYAAHVLRLGGFGNSQQAAMSGEMPYGVKRRRAGDTEIEVFASANGGAVLAGSAAWYSQSPYGVQFQMMQRREFAGPRVYPSPIQDRGRGPFWP